MTPYLTVTKCDDGTFAAWLMFTDRTVAYADCPLVACWKFLKEVCDGK
jgi:hypothetical protein